MPESHEKRMQQLYQYNTKFTFQTAYHQATDISITGGMGNGTYSNDKNSSCLFQASLSMSLG
jgi:hypothetical protein